MASRVFSLHASRKTETAMSARWKIPKWMMPYEPLIVNTGGGDVEEMMNGHANPLVNLPLSTLQACVKSQVLLLYLLYEKGIIK